MKKLAIVLVLVSLVGVACGGDDDDATGSTTTTTRAPSSTSTTGATSTTVAAGPTVKDGTGTAQRWLKAVADGDDATAVSLLSPRSLAKIGGADGYQKMKLELSEGWGAWGRSTGIELTSKTLPFPKDVAVVILHGNVSQEGPPRESWNALPVVATPDGDRVEPFLDLAQVTANPPEGGTVGNGDEVQLTTSTSSDVYVIQDTNDATMPALKDIGADGATWIWAPFGLKPGLHALTVVVTGDGVQASRFEYSVQ